MEIPANHYYNHPFYLSGGPVVKHSKMAYDFSSRSEKQP